MESQSVRFLAHTEIVETFRSRIVPCSAIHHHNKCKAAVAFEQADRENQSATFTLLHISTHPKKTNA
jgi:hypothetical protein